MNQFDGLQRKTSVNMADSLESALRKIPARTPPSGLFERIRTSIDSEVQLRALRRRVWGFAVGLLGIVAVIFGFWNLLAQELAQSSFMEYLRIFWSDRDMVMANWNDAASSLLESLPVANLIIWLILSFFIIGFVWKALETWGKSHSHGIVRHLSA